MWSKRATLNCRWQAARCWNWPAPFLPPVCFATEQVPASVPLPRNDTDDTPRPENKRIHAATERSHRFANGRTPADRSDCVATIPRHGSIDGSTIDEPNCHVHLTGARPTNRRTRASRWSTERNEIVRFDPDDTPVDRSELKCSMLVVQSVADARTRIRLRCPADLLRALELVDGNRLATMCRVRATKVYLAYSVATCAVPNSIPLRNVWSTLEHEPNANRSIWWHIRDTSVRDTRWLTLKLRVIYLDAIRFNFICLI